MSEDESTKIKEIAARALLKVNLRFTSKEQRIEFPTAAKKFNELAQKGEDECTALPP